MYKFSETKRKKEQNEDRIESLKTIKKKKKRNKTLTNYSMNYGEKE